VTDPGGETQARWRQLSELFDRALDVARPEQSAWVDARCAEDPAMATELKKMLEAFHTSGMLDSAPHPLPTATAPIADRLQAALAGRYRLEDEIGRGGMGAVFRAHELKHQRDVILKVLRPDISYSVGRQRFEAEVQIAARLAHPHIIPLLDSGDAGGLLYFVMPRLPGETLRERLERLGTLPVMDAMRLLRDIADALLHAHDAGIVHRDLKPENVLCSGDHAFLLDFGIAQYATATPEDERLTRDGHAVGTPRYMAPEQAAGNPVDHRADLYAWGLVASEMLLGSKRRDLDLGSVRSDIPAALTALVYKCLAPDPAHRPRSAGTIVAALDSIMTGASAPAPREQAVRVVAPPSRWPIVAGGVGLALVTWFVYLLVRVPAVVHASDLAMPIAVAPFRDEAPAGGNDVRGRLAGAWITQGLHEAGLFQVVPWSEVLQAVDGSADPAADPAARLKERVRAATIVSGVFYETSDALTLHAEIRETRRGSLLASLEPVSVPRDSTALAIRLVRERVMGALAARRDPRFSGVAPVLERPPTFEAYRAFDRALEQFNAQQYRPSIEGFRAAFAADSGFVPPIVYAAQAAWNTSQVELLDTLLTILDRRRGELTDYHDGLRAFLRAVLAGDGESAFTAAARAAEAAPESRAAYDAALVALWLGRPDEARRRLERLSPDRGAMLGWPSYWTNLAHARHLTGDHAAELAAAREMRRRHPTLRVAWTLEARALAVAHDTSGIDSLLTAASDLDPDVYWSQSSMLVVAGEELAAHGDSVAGMRYLRRAERATAARLAIDPTDADHLFWRGSALHSLGQYREARTVLRTLARQSPHRTNFLEQEAIAAERAGESGALARVTQPPAFDRGARLVAEARVAAARGEIEVARSRLRDALRVGYRSWPWLHGVAWRDFVGVDDPAVATLTGRP
jgi:tetratricopeptide (TPR) repeat protein